MRCYSVGGVAGLAGSADRMCRLLRAVGELSLLRNDAGDFHHEQLVPEPVPVAAAERGDHSLGDHSLESFWFPCADKRAD